MEKQKLRVDKWLWAVRICKTRSLAASLCIENKVTVNGQPAKPSRTIKPGDKIAIRKGAFIFEFQVLKEAGNRLPAREVKDYCMDITPPDVLDRYKTHLMAVRSYRQLGSGRPTKKDRRDLENFLEW